MVDEPKTADSSKKEVNPEESGEEDEKKESDETDDIIPSKKPEATVSKKSKKKKGKKVKLQTTNVKVVPKKKKEMKPPSPRISSKSTFAQIAKELKAKRLAQMAYAAAMAKKRKKNRVLRDEEVYTDKDRAAAVNMGTRDIKQSLKLKKKLDKNDSIPDEAEPGTLLALGNNEMRNGDLKIALNFINKALEINPEDKSGLVARSKCYLSLGDPQLALKDAETALQSDKTFVRAIFQKAEALYHLGDFEHSLMYYHRGHRLRPELECFRLGVQKAQEAIENTIGNTAGLNKKSEKTTCLSNSSSAKTASSNTNEKSTDAEKSKSGNDTKRSGSSLTSDKNSKGYQRRSKSAAPTVRSSKRFLGELGADRLYLENLLKHPDLICSNQEAAKIIKIQAKEGITFLKSRQEFWRQQKPNTSTKKVKQEELKIGEDNLRISIST